MTPQISKETEKINALFQTIDISRISAVEFLPNNLPSFTLDSDNIKKIVLYITEKLHKSTFSPKELQRAFDYLSKNIASTMKKEEYDIAIGEIMCFIEFGGTVKIVQTPGKINTEKGILSHIFSFMVASIGFIIVIPIILAGALLITCGGMSFEGGAPIYGLISTGIIIIVIALILVGLWIKFLGRINISKLKGIPYVVTWMILILICVYIWNFVTQL